MAQSETSSPAVGLATRGIPLRRAALTAALAGHAALLAVLLAGGSGVLGERHRSILELAGALVVLGLAADLVARNLSARPDRAAWALFGLPLAARGIGELAHAALAPSALVFYGAAIAGIALLIRDRGRTWDSLLDPLAAALAFAAIATVAVDGLIAKLETTSWLAGVYGTGDAILAGLVLALLAAHAWRPTRSTVLLATAFGLAIAADVAFLASDEPIRDLTSTAALVVWPLAATMIALAGRWSARPRDAHAARLATWSVATPAAAVLAVGVMLSDAVFEIGRLPHTLAGAAVLAVSARTALTMRRQRANAVRLETAEERYRTLVERMPAVTYLAELGETGTWHYVSPQVEALLGYAPGEFLSRASLWIELVHPDDRAAVIAAEGRFDESRPTLEVEYRMIARDGRVLHVRDEAVRVGDGSRVLGFLLDVTARRNAQLDAQRRAAQQSLVARLGQRALAGAPLQELFDEAVQAAATALDADFAEILELRLLERQLELRASVGWRGGATTFEVDPASLVGATLASPTPVTVDDVRTETRFPGTAFHHRHRVVSSVSVAIRHSGQTFGVLCVHSTRRRPFTREDADFVETVAHALAAAVQRERADAAKQHAERRFRRVLEGAPDGIVGVRPDGTIAIANRRALELFGYEDLSGVSWSALGAADDWRRAVDVRTGSSAGLAGRRADGTEFAADVSVSWLEDGELRLASVRDVTERVREQNEREELRGRLEQAQRLETVGRLTSGIAHDFNNLLLIIQSYATFLEGSVDDDTGRRHVAQILQATESATGLTQQLLQFGRRRRVDPTLVDVNEVVERVHNLLGQSLGANVDLQLRLEPGLPSVKADATQLEQVLLNLAVNARDAMPDGGVVGIDTRLVTDDDRGFVGITVRDSGVGMTPEVQEHAFEAFFTTKETGKGTGLGLATVHGIVVDAGGRIDIASELDRGTEIDVLLPVATPR